VRAVRGGRGGIGTVRKKKAIVVQPNYDDDDDIAEVAELLSDMPLKEYTQGKPRAHLGAHYTRTV
jgi:hypothetical protein